MEVGRYVDEGLVVGMDKYSSKVAKSAGYVADKIVDNFAKPLSAINDLVNICNNLYIVVGCGGNREKEKRGKIGMFLNIYSSNTIS